MPIIMLNLNMEYNHTIKRDALFIDAQSCAVFHKHGLYFLTVVKDRHLEVWNGVCKLLLLLEFKVRDLMTDLNDDRLMTVDRFQFNCIFTFIVLLFYF